MLDLPDAVQAAAECFGHRLMHRGRIGSRNDMRVIAVAAEQFEKPRLGHAGHDRGIGDLVLVQSQDR
jgi:hypothetical protein